MTVLLIENMHFEVAFSISKIFLCAGHSVVLYVNEKICTSFHEAYNYKLPQRLRIYTTKAFLGSAKEIDDVLKIAYNHEIDLLFISTLQEKFSAFYQLIKRIRKPKILTIHNINTWLSPSNRLVNPKKIIRSKYRQAILREIDAINVISVTLKEYIEQELQYKKLPVIYLPSLAGEHSNSTSEKNTKLKIIVPGSIDGRRRNYDILFDAFAKLKEQYDLFEVVLLGKLYYSSPSSITEKLNYTFSRVVKIENFHTTHNQNTGRYLNAINYLKNNGLSIHYYQNYVTESEFDKQMRSGDLILSPTQILTKYDGQDELYGKSKCSGNVNDMIKYRKPLLVPANLKIPSELIPGCILYENLEKELSNLISNPNIIEQKKESAFINTSFYQTLNVIKNLNPITQLPLKEKYQIK